MCDMFDRNDLNAKVTTYIVSILADTYFHILKTLQVKTLCIYRMERKLQMNIKL